jgi:3-phosphoshikimate 1-carboxyvinyltransferase
MIHIELPLSKSQVNRALIIVASKGNLTTWLSDNPDVISRGCRDTRLLIEALRKHSQGDSVVDFQDAGTPSRLFTAFAATEFNEPIQIAGNQSLQSRKTSPLIEALRSMGAIIEYTGKEGYPPIHIQKGIEQWRDVQISAAVSSQFASALILVSPMFSGSKKITLTEITHSQGYVDLSIQSLKQIGIEISSKYVRETREIVVDGSYETIATPTREQLNLEADWSAAAFFYPLLLGLKKGDSILLEGLNAQSEQGDVHLQWLGNLLDIDTIQHPKGVVIQRSASICEISEESDDSSNEDPHDEDFHDEKPHDEEPHDELMLVDLGNNPDLVPALVVGWCIQGKSMILQGIENLRYKECDRIAALQNNLKGIHCTLEPWQDGGEDMWLLNAENRRFPGQLHIETYEDHRIAMAFSALSPWVQELTFSNSDCVEKSFPSYWEQWKKCTFEM